MHPRPGVHRYFYWGKARLDPDPLGKDFKRIPLVMQPCANDPEHCVEFNAEYINSELSPLEKLFDFSALPTLAVEIVILEGSRRLGVNQVWTFMVSMPLLVFAWFYFLGRLIDRWRYKRSQRR